jgi:hypothetical protein
MIPRDKKRVKHKTIYSTNETENKVYLYQYVLETIHDRFPYHTSFKYADIVLYVQEVIHEFWEDVMCPDALDTNYFSLIEVVEMIYMECSRLNVELMLDKCVEPFDLYTSNKNNDTETKLEIKLIEQLSDVKIEINPEKNTGEDSNA